MASQVLLVADDLATVAAVKRVLSAQGYEVVLATSAADAVIAWGHHLPALLVLQPSVEGDRGGVVLEELQAHPDARLLRVLLLGETLPGFGYPVEPLPIETEHFADSVAEAMRGTRESMEAPTPPPPPPSAPPAPPAPAPTEEPSGTLEETLFGDISSSIEASMQHDLEAQALASVESTLAQRQQDTELQALEDDVRAEAQRRRQARERAAQSQVEEPAETPPPPSTTSIDETSFDAVDELTPPPGIAPERAAADLLARADAMRLESRAVAESTQRTSEHDARTHDAAVEALTRRAEHAESLVRREREAREALESELVQLRETTSAAVNDATAKADAETSALEARIAELTAELATLSEDLLGESARREALETDAAALAAAQGTVSSLEAELAATKASEAKLRDELAATMESTKARGDGLAESVVQLETELAALRAKVHELTNERDVLRGDLERVTTQLAAATTNLDEAKARAETAEAGVALAGERLRELELRATLPLSFPGRRKLGVARMGRVDLDGLATLAGQLVLAQADARLELAAAEGTRTLWFRRGQVVAAESTLTHESLIDRARRDGLIDARQESELRMLRHASPREQLDALKARGLVRDIEAIPLAQRYTEQLALEAFAEPASQYRLADEAPGATVLLAAAPRPTLPMVAEALRRALPVDALLEKLGGGDAVCTPNESDVDVRAAGFSERERKMLSWVDGETTVEDLALASGLKPEVAFRALLVAKVLGVISVTAPEVPRAPVSSEVDVQRLDAKYDQVQDADYFSILGLPRTAGADDVQRAFDRLAQEFDPLKYSGHPDAALQQRAQVVFSQLEEAASALGDDRRRTDYARHLAE